MLSCVAIYIFTWLLKKNWYKSAIVTLFCLFLFYSYGHVYQFLENNPIGNLSLGRHRYLIIIYSLVIITGIVGLVPNNPDALPDLYLIILDTYSRGDALLNDFHFDNSQIPPIIILMGNHGLRNANRLQILNAYYLPGDNSNILYPGISPVNSFRLIFDTYYGTNYGFLADESWLGEEGALVPETSPDCLP